jgi:hypothetical protein
MPRWSEVPSGCLRCREKRNANAASTESDVRKRESLALLEMLRSARLTPRVRHRKHSRVRTAWSQRPASSSSVNSCDLWDLESVVKTSHRCRPRSQACLRSEQFAERPDAKFFGRPELAPDRQRCLIERNMLLNCAWKIDSGIFYADRTAGGSEIAYQSIAREKRLATCAPVGRTAMGFLADALPHAKLVFAVRECSARPVSMRIRKHPFSGDRMLQKCVARPFPRLELIGACRINPTPVPVLVSTTPGLTAINSGIRGPPMFTAAPSCRAVSTRRKPAMPLVSASV